jgi:hypothetical protein
MTKMSSRTASIYCLVVWAAIWLMFLLIRFSRLDIRVIPGIGPFMLIALVVVLLAPLVATGIAGAAVVRQPRIPLNWLTLGCAILVLLGQMHLFMTSGWM